MNTLSLLLETRWLETLGRDLVCALRAMRKNPVFVVTAILTLALAIGGNTAMFTVIRAVLLSPLEYHDPDRLVRISGGATPTRFAEMRAAARSFTGIGAYAFQEELTLSGRNEPEVLAGVRVSSTFLGILGVTPILGRGFRPEEDSPGGPPVALISSELWKRRFGSDPRVIGSKAVLAAAPYTIIGVLPPRFQFPFAGIDVWLTAPSEFPQMAPKSRALSPFLTVFGRLKPGLTLDQANAEMSVIWHQYAAAHPTMLDAKPKTQLKLTTVKDALVSNVRSMLWMLFGAVGFVLMIACANVASLLLTRATSRAREFAVRAALGASRRRLIEQLLAESILLSIFGGALGVLFAAVGLQAIRSITALDLPRMEEVHMDWRVLGFATALSVVTGLLFGLAPSLGASRPDLIRVLRASGEGANKENSKRTLAGLNGGGLLSAGQVALSVVLLIGTALLMQSVASLRNVETGFNPANLLTARINLSPLRYDTEQKQASFYEELEQQVGSLPGVRSAAAAMVLPMTSYAATPIQDAAKPPLRLNERLIAKLFPVTPSYFRTLAIPLRRGRQFTQHDTQFAQPVAIIDENLAGRFWPGYPAGQDPVGQRILIGGINLKPAEIVGVVGDVHQNLDDRKDWQESVYVPLAQNAQASAMIAVRTTGNPLSFTRAVREQVEKLDRDQPIADVQTMDTRVEAQVGQRRLLVSLLSSFALVALSLALIGIYGMMSYSVAQRVQEVAIRRALGAQRSDILRLIVGRGVFVALVGIIAGLGCAVALTRVMTTLLFHVSATDPATFVSVAVLFVLVALVASYIPARRATRIDPVAALRV